MNAKYAVDQIIRILAEASMPGNSVAAVCRKYSVSHHFTSGNLERNQIHSNYNLLPLTSPTLY